MYQRTDKNHSSTAKANIGGNRIAYIQACWHKDIVDQCRIAFIKEMATLGYAKKNIDIFDVPGSLEIPLQAKLLAKSGTYAAIVASGFIVNGGIYRHEFVADAVIKGIMDVMLAHEVPIISAILTPQNYHEHEQHHRFFFDHFQLKGREAAMACARTIENIAQAKMAA